MTTDRGRGPDSNGSSGTSVEIGGSVRELAEALTALGNYLAAANRILADGPTPPVERLGDVLEKSMGQYERAAKAARQLHRLYCAWQRR
jgi:hypothetical protein